MTRPRWAWNTLVGYGLGAALLGLAVSLVPAAELAPSWVSYAGGTVVALGALSALFAARMGPFHDSARAKTDGALSRAFVTAFETTGWTTGDASGADDEDHIVRLELDVEARGVRYPLLAYRVLDGKTLQALRVGLAIEARVVVGRPDLVAFTWPDGVSARAAPP